MTRGNFKWLIDRVREKRMESTQKMAVARGERPVEAFSLAGLDKTRGNIWKS